MQIQVHCVKRSGRRKESSKDKSQKGKRKRRKKSIKRKDEGNKNEWGWSKKRKEIVSYFL